MANGSLTIPKTAQVNGTCSFTDSMMILSWKDEKHLDSELDESDQIDSNTVVLNFVNKDSKAYLDNIETTIYLDDVNFPYALSKKISQSSLLHIYLLKF